MRASGSGSLEVLDAIVMRGALPRRGIAPVRLRVPAPGMAALVLRLPGPGSATGEDAFELLLPGNPLLLDRVIDEVIAVDPRVRRAGPGEFSARAFLNGRMTLDEAEGVADLIVASNDTELAAAQRLARGALAERVGQWSTTVAELTALLEAGIDFTDEEDVVAIAPKLLAERVKGVIADMRAELGDGAASEGIEGVRSSEGARESKRGTARSACVTRAEARSARAPSWQPRVVLVGPPNAGKSTLFNALARAPRTVASPAAGTTRDAVEVQIGVPGLDRLWIVDLPGLDEGDDALSARTRDAALRAIEEADLALRCTPVQGARALPPAVVDALARVPVLEVTTQCDLVRAPDRATPSLDHALRVSALTGEGLAALSAAIGAALGRSTPSLAGGLALRPRHRAALAGACEHLHAAQERALGEPPAGPWRSPEQTAASLRAALDALGTITGQTTPDEVLALVFARFCIGK